MTSSGTIKALKEFFCRMCLPDVVVSDNAKGFISDEIRSFFTKYGITWKNTPPFHPASNGQAEINVKLIKHALIKATEGVGNGGNIQEILNEFLFAHRTTPHCTTKITPAELMFGRKLKTVLALLKNDTSKNVTDDKLQDIVQNNVQKAQARQRQHFQGERVKVFDVNDTVTVKNYRIVNKVKWIKGIVRKRIGPRSYLIFIPELDRTWKRHINQIIHFNFSIFVESEKVEDFNVPSSDEINVDEIDNVIEEPCIDRLHNDVIY